MWTTLKRMLKKKPNIVSHGAGPDSKKFYPKWGVIIPHTKIDGGANNINSIKYKFFNEYNYALDMIDHMPVPFATRDNGKGVAGAAKQLIELGCTASLEPHLNAYNRKAKGFEILVLKGDRLSAYYAEMIAQNFKDYFTERVLRHGNGVKIVSKNDRGYANLIAAKNQGMEVALLSEAFFIDNDQDFISPFNMGPFWRENLI